MLGVEDDDDISQNVCVAGSTVVRFPTDDCLFLAQPEREFSGKRGEDAGIYKNEGVILLLLFLIIINCQCVGSIGGGSSSSCGCFNLGGCVVA